jgi:predicted esterase
VDVDQTRSQDPASERTSAPKRAPSSVLEGSLSTKNRSDRSGAYFIPEGASLPLLVALHGSGGNGSGAVQAFRGLALQRRFAVVAPDSGFIAEAGTYTWYVAHKAGDPSLDSEHIARSIDEVLTLAGGRIAPTGWLAIGHSGGASSAPYLATHDARFVAFGVLHGGAFPDAFGPLRPRGWFSTGDGDPVRTSAHVGSVARSAAVVLGPSRVENHVFSGGHGLSPEEIEGVIAFWFGSVAPR